MYPPLGPFGLPPIPKASRAWMAPTSYESNRQTHSTSSLPPSLRTATEPGPPFPLKTHALKDILFQHCMHGGTRSKWTRWRSNTPAFVPLALVCTGGHTHQPFSAQRQQGSWRFDKACEAAYPQLLCTNISRCVLDMARATGMDTSIRADQAARRSAF